jgi:phage antirepressor YoqD-like protein
MSLQTFLYDNNPISFDGNESVMINATEMARAFNKVPGKWLELTSTKEFLLALGNIRKTDNEKLIYTERGGSSSGSWFHEDVALEFARWLSPTFAIWCNDRIKELIRHGVTATPAKLEELLSDPDTMIAALTQLKEERAQKELAQEQLKLANNTIQLQAPKAIYFDTVLQSQTLIKVDTIALQLGVSATKLNLMAAEAKIQFKRGKTWYLYSKYRDQGLADYKTHTYTDTAGRQCTSQWLHWTEKGRKFLLDRFERKAIAA